MAAERIHKVIKEQLGAGNGGGSQLAFALELTNHDDDQRAVSSGGPNAAQRLREMGMFDKKLPLFIEALEEARLFRLVRQVEETASNT